MHSFNPNIAAKYGVNEAIMLDNLYFWIEKNKANERHFYDEKYWTYSSIRGLAILFPYWSEKQIRRIIDSLIKHGLIITGNYNKFKFDQTRWFALTELGNSICPNGQMDVTKKANENCPKGQMSSDQKGKPIPDTKDTVSDTIEKIDKKETLDDLVFDELKSHNLILSVTQFDKLLEWFKLRLKHKRCKNTPETIKKQINRLVESSKYSSIDNILKKTLDGNDMGVYQNIIEVEQRVIPSAQNYPTVNKTKVHKDAPPQINCDDDGVLR